MWVVSGLLTAVYLPIADLRATPANVAYLLLVFGLLYGAPYAVSATYMSESFPDRRSRHGRRHVLQPRAHRVDAFAAAHRLGRDELLDRLRDRPARHLLRGLRDHPGSVHQGEDVRSESGRRSRCPDATGARSPHAGGARTSIALAPLDIFYGPSRDE